MEATPTLRRPVRRLAPLDRRRYLVYGVVLSALKLGVDQLVARGVCHRDWSLLDYFVPSHAFTLPSVPPVERPFYGTMASVVVRDRRRVADGAVAARRGTAAGVRITSCSRFTSFETYAQPAQSAAAR